MYPQYWVSSIGGTYQKRAVNLKIRLYLRKKTGALQRRAERQIENSSHNNSDNRVNQCGYGTHLCPNGGHILRNTQDIRFVEIPNYGICNNVECHACRAGKCCSYGKRELSLFFIADMKDFVRNKTRNQTNTKLQNKGFGRRGNIAGR